MKKNFFKKLSFVLALAMIISVIAPAAGALAATGLRLNATSKTLMLGENNTYNFNALGKTKGATEKWTTSNAKIAAVNAKNGVVTAKAVGKATITATVTNAKKTVTKKLTAKVTVGDSIKSLSIVAPANAADLAKLTVATDYDFNRTFETMGGSKTKTSNITVWFVNDAPATLAKAGEADGATIDTAGVFKAEKAGEYTITARAFRYKAQYEAWVKAGSNADDTKYIKASDSVKVTVLNAIKEVKQTSTKKFTVEFAGAVNAEDITAKASVVQVLNGKEISTGAEKVKEVKLDSTGTIATVEVSADFIGNSTYKFVYGDMSATFVAASKELKDVKGIVFEDFTVNTTVGNTGADLLDHVYAVNADGVQIMDGNDVISSYLTFEVADSDKTKGFVDSTLKKVYINAAGNAVTVKATYTNYVYNEETKKYDSVVLNDSAVVTGVSADVNTDTLQFAVNKGTSSSNPAPATLSKAWTTPISVSLNDNDGKDYYIHGRYKKTTDGANDPYTAAGSEFVYSPTDTSKLSIYGNTLYPLAVGTTTVLVKSIDGKKVYGSFDVTITPERVLTTATPNTAVETVGNDPLVGEVKTIEISVLDNLGENLKNNQIGTNVTTSLFSEPVNATVKTTILSAKQTRDGIVAVTFDGRGATAGLYRYKVTMTDSTTTGSVSREVVIGIQVVDVNSNRTVVSYLPVFESTDTYGAFGPRQKTVDSANFVYLSGPTTYDVSVYGLNSAGFRVIDATSNFDAEIKFGNSDVGSRQSASSATFTVASGSAAALKSVTSGAYNLTVTNTTTSTKYVSGFNMTDTHIKSAVVTNSSVKASSVTSIYDLLNKALDVTVTAGEHIKKVNFMTDSVVVEGIYQSPTVGVITNGSVASGTTLYITKVTVTFDVSGSGTSKVYEIPVTGGAIAIQ